MFYLPIALITTAAAALVNFWLGWRIGQIRRAEGIFVGDGGNPRLVSRMRAQLNFAEFVPVVLILIALVELARGTQTWLWLVALLFVVGRILHGIGMDGWKPGRMIGTLSTMLIMIGMALYAAWLGYVGMNPLG